MAGIAIIIRAFDRFPKFFKFIFGELRKWARASPVANLANSEG